MGASKKTIIVILIVSLILFLSSPCLAGMTVQEVISNMQKAYEKQMKGVNDFTVIHRSTGGMAALAGDTVTHYKKVKLDGQDIYKSRIESQVMGMDMVIINDGRYYWATNPMTGEIDKEISEHDSVQIWRNLDPVRTQYLGEEEVNGDKAYVLKFDNPIQVMGKQQAMSQQEEEPEEPGEMWGTLWISSKTWMPLRMLMEFKAESMEEAEEMIMIMKMTTDLKDYRQVGTMLHPHQMVMSTTMELDTAGLSEEEKKEGQAMMQMMSTMMSGMGSFTIDTIDIKVNTGLSDDLFDGNKLE
jgi:outer membrane lipoprotein-sorting protein